MIKPKPALDPVPVAQAYKLWAPTYDRENPVSALDQAAVNVLSPSLVGCRLLDVACGTGRRLPEKKRGGPQLAVGVDLEREMLRRGAQSGRAKCFVAADMRVLPVPDDTFDIVWCRLAIGHTPDLHAVYREFARVVARGGTVIVTDFHPTAVEAGHRRTFRDETGCTVEVKHITHLTDDHRRAAAAHALQLTHAEDFCVGASVRGFYLRAGMEDQYEEQCGLPLVLALRLSK